jgi:hypothetical protein
MLDTRPDDDGTSTFIRRGALRPPLLLCNCALPGERPDLGTRKAHRSTDPMEELLQHRSRRPRGSSGGVWYNHPVLVGPDHRLYAVSHAELHQDTPDVGLDGAFLDDKDGGDFGIRQALSH